MSDDEDRVSTGSTTEEPVSTRSTTEGEAELAFEGALRPRSLAEFVGQVKVRGQLQLLLDAAAMQNRTPDHILLAGPPGLGKTTLAMIVAYESNRPLRMSSGPAIQHAGDLAALLSSLVPGEVLFIDEIHRMARSAEEMLYLAMEDFRIDIMVGKGAGATSIPLDLSPFTLVGATTRSGLLPNPLRDRFGFTANLEFYDDGELDQVLERGVHRVEARSPTTHQRVVADTAQQPVRDARRAAGPPRDLVRAVAGQDHPEQLRRPAQHLLQLGGLVELEVRGEAEAVAQRRRQHP